MYHSVGPERPGWQWNYLMTPAGVFEEQMRILHDRGWNTISLKQLYMHMKEGTPVPDHPVVLTFDDGYLDNWVYAFPILKKYGHRAVIWMSSDFIDPRSDMRSNLDDVWNGNARHEELDINGFLSRGEMKSMIESGHVEIQSHGKTHTWYYAGPEIVDFHRPDGIAGYQAPPWLGWNLFPDSKHEYLARRLTDLVPLGTPIYRSGKSLAVRRYFEDTALTEALTGHVAKEGGEAFFSKVGWREELAALVRDHGPLDDRLETEAEYESRVRYELEESRRILESSLGVEVEFLCWPGGGRTPRTLEIAREVGFLATTTHYEDKTRKNIFGQDPAEINRIGSGSPWNRQGKVFYRTDPGFFMAGIASFAGDKKSVWIKRFYKLKYLLGYYMCGTVK
jgi:peptidoglycan/xylan/chitin deacetylase (PgdA/CDA1 family)